MKKKYLIPTVILALLVFVIIAYTAVTTLKQNLRTQKDTIRAVEVENKEEVKENTIKENKNEALFISCNGFF